jgi:hypothetical protein
MRDCWPSHPRTGSRSGRGCARWARSPSASRCVQYPPTRRLPTVWTGGRAEHGAGAPLRSRVWTPVTCSPRPRPSGRPTPQGLRRQAARRHRLRCFTPSAKAEAARQQRRSNPRPHVSASAPLPGAEVSNRSRPVRWSNSYLFRDPSGISTITGTPRSASTLGRRPSASGSAAPGDARPRSCTDSGRRTGHVLRAGGIGVGRRLGVRGSGAAADDGLLHGPGEVVPRCQRSATWTAWGAPARAPSALPPERSRQTTSMPGCSPAKPQLSRRPVAYRPTRRTLERATWPGIAWTRPG